MIKSYRKKPVVIQALQFTGDNYKECKAFIGDNYDNTLDYPNIKTLEGTMAVDRCDYIIKGVNGEFYPCKPDIFRKTYNSVDRLTFKEKLDDIVKSMKVCINRFINDNFYF
jgi:hypothetical protein